MDGDAARPVSSDGSPIGGSYTLTANGRTSPPIPYNASVQQRRAAEAVVWDEPPFPGVWQVSVRVPLDLPAKLRGELLTVIADAVCGWEPVDQVEWDVVVTAGPSHPPNVV